MEIAASDFFSGLLAIILLDLVLAGDNAIVIAMAASRLPKALQRKAVFWAPSAPLRCASRSLPWWFTCWNCRD